MELLQVLCMSFLSVFSTCNAKSYRGHGGSIFFTDEDPIERVPICRYQNKPCTILVRDYHGNGTLRGEFRSNNMCQCPRGRPCPNAWDNDPDRTITRYLRTRGNEMTLQMKFCQPVQTERQCNPYDVALSLMGRSIVPQDITAVNCRCPGNAPLYKRMSWSDIRAPSIRNEDYVCEMAECGDAENAPCLLKVQNATRRETSFICHCPGNKRCRNFNRSLPGTRNMIGTCTEGL